MLGEVLRSRRHGLLHGRGADQLREAGSLLQGVGIGDLLAADQQRTFRRQQATGESRDHLRGRDGPRVHTRPMPEFGGNPGVEHVAGQGQEHRTRRRGHGDLGGPSNHPRQIFRPGNLEGPLDARRGHRHQLAIEHRFHEAVSLFLLSGTDDDGRAAPVCVEDGAHGVPQAGCDMHVAGGEPARGAGEPVGHRHDDGLLESEHVVEIGVLGERVHHRQFGRARIAEQVSDAFVLQDAQEDRAAARGVHAAILAGVV